MSKRLEEIKTSTINICSCESCYCDGFNLQWIGVEPEHFEWLVEQAERVQELRMFQKHTVSLAEVVSDLEQRNKRYRESLEGIKDKIPLKYKYELELSNALVSIAVILDKLEDDSE